MNYKGYKIREGINMGNLVDNLTPKGARAVGFSNYIIPYIQSYRGGRNESFMYGIEEIKDNRKTWYDYDLTSCYTTVMSLLGHPDLNKATRVYNKTISKMSKETLLNDYIALEVDFKFPAEVKYPCIPTRAGDKGDIYPREGRSVITGIEYIVARSMGCHLQVISGVLVPRMSTKDLINTGILKSIKPIIPSSSKGDCSKSDSSKGDSMK